MPQAVFRGRYISVCVGKVPPGGDRDFHDAARMSQWGISKGFLLDSKGADAKAHPPLDLCPVAQTGL